MHARTGELRSHSGEQHTTQFPGTHISTLADGNAASPTFVELLEATFSQVRELDRIRVGWKSQWDHTSVRIFRGIPQSTFLGAFFPPKTC
jgi:hypothetical protein